MNLTTILGKKIEQTQAFLQDGTRIPLTRIFVGENSVSQIKTIEKDGYNSLQLAFGRKNKASKSLAGHIKKAGIKNTPRFLREVRVDDVAGFENGVTITPEEVLTAGDKVDVVGTSKGKGFAGAVKRWHFKGGPKTHGQSDRHRAPGSIGQSTTPGRVYKGKRMAGRMGQDRVTIKNLEVAEVKDGEVLIKGLIPGPIGGTIMITKIGENKKFRPLYSTVDTESDKEQDTSEVLAENEVISEEATKEVVSEEKTQAVNETSSEEVSGASSEIEEGATVEEKASDAQSEKVSEPAIEEKVENTEEENK